MPTALRATSKAAKRVIPAAQAGLVRNHTRQAAFDYDRMLTLAEASVITGISPDTLRRHYQSIIRRLSPRRVGIRLKDALSVGDGHNAAA
jgi:hypothetical protein